MTHHRHTVVTDMIMSLRCSILACPASDVMNAVVTAMTVANCCHACMYRWVWVYVCVHPLLLWVRLLPCSGTRMCVCMCTIVVCMLAVISVVLTYMCMNVCMCTIAVCVLARTDIHVYICIYVHYCCLYACVEQRRTDIHVYICVCVFTNCYCVYDCYRAVSYSFMYVWMNSCYICVCLLSSMSECECICIYVSTPVMCMSLS